MKIEALDIPAVKLITPQKYEDKRGFFMETFSDTKFNQTLDEKAHFVQDNHSFSFKKGTVRGLHFQVPPYAQGKLVRCIRGSIIDVAVDARQNSPTYGSHISAKLSAKNAQQLWVPIGFLHGFVTLEPDTEVVYKVTNYYSKECDGNVLWNDPDLGIDWGLDERAAILSEKDMNAPLFKNFKSPF